MNASVLFAIAAAALFGASTPLAKLLASDVPPLLLAGLLYLGSGLGLGLLRLLRDRGWRASGLQRAEWPWLLGAIVSGGILGPVALMAGLAVTAGATASLMLNLEAVLTAALAWLVFRENAGRRVVLGMAAIVAGGALLAWQSTPAAVASAVSVSVSVASVGSAASSAVAAAPALPAAPASASAIAFLSSLSPSMGLAAIAFACLCWAIDNNLTRKVAGADALFIASTKGLVAGVVNGGLALLLGAALPAHGVLLATLAVGLAGYGVSLVLFVLALRGLGSARTGAYFSTAPFIGAAASLGLLGEPASPAFGIAAALMGAGVWLHVTEHHEHEHTHEPVEHAHLHVHDQHHRHAHDAGWDGQEPHRHAHRHERLTHRHPHYPDLHHRHRH